ncbi:37-kD nucleoid-associated bacterial protein [Clostridium tepidiprofundi DSM 19306]|uniref:37-kD nucleoid-associated bacterial protein n=1 Tax=Clostridium tepidiprofundi DSM 19306 TaxID=1121338 RepID=A0A151B2M6_9CLOT|nr:nucleoid-associated protein [Clostridium tepidiprofundi]KYH34050.1 37-kD nucleoid-associated bacterial protein [Clostridium tepidiprofundi DSM 19306]
MEYIKEIDINEAIIHILDTNGDEPILNNFVLELSDEIYAFLLKHIRKCLNDEELKYAVFKSERNIVKEVSQEFLNGNNNLIDTSSELARQLFILMKSKGNIPSADLIVVSMFTEYGPMLAILKMDYIKNYTHTVDFIDNKVGINIIPQFIGLPGNSQRVQKCAFIKIINEENSFDLMVLDKKKKTKENDNYGSNYFLDNFLGCNTIDNERDNTKKFYTTVEKWTRENFGENADKAEKIRTAVRKKLKEEDEIDLKEFSKEIFEEDKYVNDNFIQFSKEQGVSDKVKIDKEWAQKKLKRTRLKIDNDIDLYINEDVYHDNSRFEIKRNGDGSIDIVLKHIKNYIEK